MAKTKFVLNRKNFREQILKGPGTVAVLRETLGEDAVTDIGRDGVRARARLYGSMADEAKNGTLSRRLGGS
ncbi:MAG: hypothetical protein D3X82_13820 [Candidatus Leucobacter sulfamidivorax]|nr:hypothetical protein [Candidatus Leucobacter sulfamidivorax]